jgi:hypothetical protein
VSANLASILGTGLLLIAISGCIDGTRGTGGDTHNHATQDELATAPSSHAPASDVGETSELYPVQRDSEGPAGFDGWDSEAFSVIAGRQFEQLLSAWNESESGMAEVIDPNCVATPLRPKDLAVTWKSPWARVSIGLKTPAGSLPVELDFARASVALRELFAGCEDVHGKFKVIDVQIASERVSTRQFVSLVGHVGDRTIESHATWYTEWTRSLEEPRITRVEREAYQETEVTRTLFADCAAGVLPDDASLRHQLSHGNSHWRYRIEGHYAIHQFGYNGVAIADINGDGLDDAYVCQPGGLPNLLLLQQADGTTQSAAPAYGVDYLDNTRSALCVDLDNDGDQDLVLAQEHWVLMLNNDGAGKFIERSRIKVDQVFSMVAADVDNDRWVDIYLCVYNGNQAQVNEIPVPYPIYDANNGGRNRLVHNRGGWEFADGTEAFGLDENNSRFSFAAQWTDFDRDGDLDLYVANDFGRNNLYRNDAGRFRDVAAEWKVEDATTGMSVTTETAAGISMCRTCFLRLEIE